jgi:hypothetical protein
MQWQNISLYKKIAATWSVLINQIIFSN